MRSTPVIALAALLACLPARAVESIDLHVTVQLPADPPPYFVAHSMDFPGERWGEQQGEGPPAVPLAVEPLPAPLPINPATPVPEPVSVLMLACGLLLMVPGAWAARWTRLGDDECLLKRRLP